MALEYGVSRELVIEPVRLPQYPHHPSTRPNSAGLVRPNQFTDLHCRQRRQHRGCLQQVDHRLFALCSNRPQRRDPWASSHLIGCPFPAGHRYGLITVDESETIVASEALCGDELHLL
jgi:hypothetical protein